MATRNHLYVSFTTSEDLNNFRLPFNDALNRGWE